MKQITLIFLILMMGIFLCACGTNSPDTPTPSTSESASESETQTETEAETVPDGAIELTKDNFSEFFEITVRTECSYDQKIGKIIATSYVSFTPKGEYSSVSGFVRFKLNSKVFNIATAFGSWPIALNEQSVELGNGTTSKEFSATVVGDEDATFRVVDGTDNLTINGVSGYIVAAE